MNADQRRCKTALYRALRRGEIVRPETCEVCGAKPGRNAKGRALIEAHHHRGYDVGFEIDIQWLCSPCHHEADPGRLGLPHSEADKQRISLGLRRAYATMDPRRRAEINASRAAATKKAWIGRKHTPETRAKISATRLARYGRQT